MAPIKEDYRAKGLRRNLVKALEAKGIKDQRVLAAIGAVPRHIFFDAIFLEHAYEDKAFPIGAQQTISQPYTVAMQTQLLEIVPGEKVLEIGTGSGYQAAVLAQMGADVYTLEVIKELYDKSKVLVRNLGYRIRQFHADGTKGLPAFAPFDKILVTAGAPSIPEQLIQQMKIGGKLICPVGELHEQRMIRITKESTQKLLSEDFGVFRFVPLTGDQGWK
jgi:protein-L-isoaspartate(D-aspartate) O-methyltransferase